MKRTYAGFCPVLLQEETITKRLKFLLACLLAVALLFGAARAAAEESAGAETPAAVQDSVQDPGAETPAEGEPAAGDTALPEEAPGDGPDDPGAEVPAEDEPAASEDPETDAPHEEHVFPDDGWTVRKEATCLEAGEEYAVCAVCGEEITREIPKKDHAWKVLTLQEPTCTEPGVLVRVCTECALEDRQETPALGHVFDWVEDDRGHRAYQCVICGLVEDMEEAEEAPSTTILYNNTITSFGPTTRELIGGTVWNRVTPLDVSEAGVYTYPLIASNRYTVGTATVVVEDGWQTVSYQLNSNRILVHSESLVFYSDLDALRAGTDGQAFDFGQPIRLTDTFGKDTRLIMGITLKADYDMEDPMIRWFSGDDEQIAMMNDLLD
ncbi:MAG: hypothetical protein J5472_04770 [Clostridia bacterium]|nr:hypothetical protein [Clostridia bacterium]